jgi:hypothetical protein
MLDWPPGRLGDLGVPIIAPTAQLHAKQAAALMPGHPLTPKHRDDIQHLKRSLSADQQRPSRASR